MTVWRQISSAPNGPLRYDNFIAPPQLVRQRSRGRLPHWEVDDATYSITFRLKDSLPPVVMESLIGERRQMLRGCPTDAARSRIDAAFAIRLDRELDAGRGSCLLKEHGQIVADALRHFDRSRYELHAWCVMPNHVHAMLHVPLGSEVPRILHSWKSYTSHRIGAGNVWQREYFDRVVRSPEDFVNTRLYIQANPAKAGYRDWPWVG